MSTPTPYATERLTAGNAAMVLIDHQTGTMLLGVRDVSPVELRNNTVALAKAARLHHLPTVLTDSAADGPNGPLMREVTDTLPDAALVHRPGPISAWDDPAFVQAVTATGRRKLIMAGVTSDICLLFPALQALDAGYEVYAVLDASGAWDAMTTQIVIARLTQAGAVVINTRAVVADLQADWRRPEAAGTLEIFHDVIPNYDFLINNLSGAHQDGSGEGSQA